MAGDRLTGLDASFLHLEDAAAHMHVASVMVFEGDPPPYDELLETIERRLHLVPRYRQRLAFVPLGQGRPRWVDDPHLNLRYHVRATALPSPGCEDQLRALAGRVFAQPLDRDKPLWEIWIVEGLEGGGFALLSKTHHALVDGVSGVDIMTVLFDTSPEPAAPPDPGQRWLPAPAAVGRRSCSARRCWSAPPSPASSRAPCAPSSARPRQIASGAGGRRHRRRRDGLGRPQPGARQPLQRADRPAPALHLGAHEPGGHQGDQERARRHGERRGAGLRGRRAGPPPAPPRPADRRARAEGDGAGERARGRRARRPGQQGRGHDGSAAGVVPGAGRAPGHRARGDEGAQGGRPGGGRPGAHRPDRLRAAHGDGPGLAADGPPAHVQPRGHQRARAPVPALPDGPRGDRPVPDGAAGQGPGPGHRDHELRRQDELRPGRRLRRDVRPRRPGARTSTTRSRSWPTPPVWSCATEAPEPARPYPRRGARQSHRAGPALGLDVERPAPGRVHGHRRRTPPRPWAATTPRSPSRSCSSPTATRCSASPPAPTAWTRTGWPTCWTWPRSGRPRPTRCAPPRASRRRRAALRTRPAGGARRGAAGPRARLGRRRRRPQPVRGRVRAGSSTARRPRSRPSAQPEHRSPTAAATASILDA